MFKRHVGFSVLSVLVILMIAAGSVFAASTTKTLSTNFTLVNLGSQDAEVMVDYILQDGSAWPNVASTSKSFTLAANGGQTLIRQYFDTMDPGAGSAVVSSSQPLGAIAQIQARNQTSTLGAYKGASEGGSSFLAPLLARRGYSASGLVNAQIIIQNAGDAPVDVDVVFSPNPKANGDPYTKKIVGIAKGASYYYDLEEDATIKENWFGSAVVNVASTTSTGKIVVIVNVFAGSNGLQTYNAFPAGAVTNKWIAPLFAIRLSNGLATVVSVQNLSGSTIEVGEMTLACVKLDGTPLTTVTNPTAIANNASYSFNPATDKTLFPDSLAGLSGSCIVSTASKNFVSFVQMRVVGKLPNESIAAYEAIPANGTSTSFFVPLVSKRLSNGFATVVNIANLSTLPNTIHIDYVPSAECPVSLCDRNTDGLVNALDKISPADFDIPGESGNERSHRYGEPDLPVGWTGSMLVTSVDGLPIGGVVQLTNVNVLPGDTHMAHGVFGK